MPGMTPLPLRVSAEVSDAIASGRGVVALESTLLSHGLPKATAAQTARRVEDAVRGTGAVPATVAVLDGTAHVGLDEDQVLALEVPQSPGLPRRTPQPTGKPDEVTAGTARLSTASGSASARIKRCNSTRAGWSC